MTFDQLVTITIRPGMDAEFEAAADKLAAGAKASEPGTLDYRLFRVRGKADTYMFIESYANEAALDLHRANPATQAHFKAVGACLAGRPVVEVIEPV